MGRSRERCAELLAAQLQILIESARPLSHINQGALGWRLKVKNISFVALILFATCAPIFAQDGPTGTWQAVDVPSGSPWTFELKADGRKLTGTAREASGAAVEISAGKINESTIVFKTTRCPDTPCETIITFTGTVKGDEIKFTRYVEARGGGVRLGNGLFGAAPSSLRTFTVKRVPETAAGAAAAPETAAPATPAPKPAISSATVAADTQVQKLTLTVSSVNKLEKYILAKDAYDKEFRIYYSPETRIATLGPTGTTRTVAAILQLNAGADIFKTGQDLSVIWEPQGTKQVALKVTILE
jgi:hypothetical protein